MNHKTEVQTMKALERKINGTFSPVPGGYAQQRTGLNRLHEE